MQTGPTAAQLVSEIMQELDTKPVAQHAPPQLSGMKRPAEGDPVAEAPPASALERYNSHPGPVTPAATPAGVPIKPSDPRKRLALHAGQDRRVSAVASSSSTAQPEQQLRQDDESAQAQPQIDASAQKQQRQQQQQQLGAEGNAVQNGAVRVPPPPPPPRPGGPPPAKGRLGSFGADSQHHMGPPIPSPVGWGPHGLLPPLAEMDPWEAQQRWGGAPGPSSSNMQQHWDDRGQPPPPGYWDGPSSRHHDQYPKHGYGDRPPLPQPQGDRHRAPLGIELERNSSRDMDFDGGRGCGRGSRFDLSLGRGRGGRGYDARELHRDGEQRGFQGGGPYNMPPLGPGPLGPHQEPPYRPAARGRGRSRSCDRGAGDEWHRPDERMPGDCGNAGGWDRLDDTLLGPTGCVRRSMDRRRPLGRGMDGRGRGRGRPPGPGPGRMSLSPERLQGRGPGPRGHREPPAQGPRPDNRERSRERSTYSRSRDGRSPDRLLGSDRTGLSPRRSRSPGSPHDRRRTSVSPRRLSSADGAPVALVVPGAQEAYAAAFAAKHGGSLAPASSSGADTGPAAGSSDKVDRGGQERSRSYSRSAAAPSLCALIWAQQESIKLQLRDLQACVPGLQPRQEASSHLQMLFIEEQQGQNVVVAGPATVLAALSGDGRVGFSGAELKPVLQQLHGSVIVNMHPSEPNPDRPKGADDGGWPDALIVTVKGSGKAAATSSRRDPRAAMLIQQQQHQAQQQQQQESEPAAEQQAWVQQQQLTPQQGHTAVEQVQVAWQQQQVAGQHQGQAQQQRQAWVSDTAGPSSTDGSHMYQQVQHVVHATQDSQQYVVQRPATVMVATNGVQAMNAPVQGLQVVSPHGAGAAGVLHAAAAGMAQHASAGAAGGYHVVIHQSIPSDPGMQAAAAGAQPAATASFTSAPAAGIDEQYLAAAAAAIQPAGAADAHAGTSGQHAGGSPVHSTGTAAAGQAGAVSSDEAAGAGPAPASASALPALPAAPGGQLTDEIMDAVVELVTLLNKDVDASLDIGTCAEVLYDMQEDPATAKRFMRVAYTALCSAVRVHNPAGAVSVVKRYLQKANA